MASSIGAKNFISAQGAPSGAGDKVEDITRPGVAGVALRKISRKGQPFQVQTVVDVGNPKTEIDACKALEGTVVDYVDDTDHTWSDCVVLSVDTTEQKKILGAVGGLNDGDYLVRMNWQLQSTGT